MLQPATVTFLKKLKKNNNREWFGDHRSEYLDAKEDFDQFTVRLITATSAYDESVAHLQPKDCIFRIHRDVRFSKNKTPYKTNMGAYLSKGGKKSNYGGYYFQVEPGDNSFVGGGVWMPPAPELNKIRQEIDYSFQEFKKILSSKNFKKYYTKLSDEGEHMLVNVPKGYGKENPAAQYLRMKSFVGIGKIKDDALTKGNLVKDISQHFAALTPLVNFLNRALD